MRELILIFSYIVCAFLPPLVYRRLRRSSSLRLFWVSWVVSLTGAFIGGLFGAMLIARIGWDLGFAGDLASALIGATALTMLYMTLRELPGNW